MKPKIAAATIEILLGIMLFGALAGSLAPSINELDIAAKVAQAQTDLRSIGVALEAYRSDNTRYPFDFAYYSFNVGADRAPRPLLKCLTTPVAYMPRIPDDVFPTTGTVAGGVYNGGYRYFAKDWLSFTSEFSEHKYNGSLERWALVCSGPDLTMNNGEFLLFGEDYLNSMPPDSEWGIGPGCLYDPSNGTLSAGDIVHLSGNNDAEATAWETYK